ncbi:unnamed protein product [Staurois parvus]|uniref:Uncharacterized protein n=1 Tax=Staurois parvus TaxID=386267 RepID=A0ABN9G267_9NEOB|nr:unnamed protein product [Staurois parvus]
MSVLSVGNTLQ